jgi:WD40 repeat protein
MLPVLRCIPSCCCGDTTAKLWLINSNGTSATCTATLGGHTDHRICTVAFHPCLPLVATICGNLSLKVWVLNSEGTAATCTASLKGPWEGKRFSVFCPHNSVTFHPHLPLLAANFMDCYNAANCMDHYDQSKVKLWLLNSDGTAATCTSTLEGIIGDSRLPNYTSGSVAFHPRLPLLATVFYSLQPSQRKRAPTTRTTSFRFCFCPEPKPQMPPVLMLAGGWTLNSPTGTASEHGRSGLWTSGGAPFSMNKIDFDSDGN